LNPEPSVLSGQIQTLWTLVSAALVLYMQAGFTVLEAGTVRHKNSINVAIKNVVTLCVSFPMFYLIGYSLMFGPDHSGVYGTPVLFMADRPVSEFATFVFQAGFCCTSTTIVSGGVAERCRFLPYTLVIFVMSIAIYPLFGHAVWGGGLLARAGYHDFAGSSVVHMAGAGVTLAGIQVLGPRRGRFGPNGEPRAVPASSMPMVALGVVILAFGWIGFNGGSAPLSERTGMIVANTLLAGCFGGLAALLVTWAYRGLASVDLILNGLLGGLVAITAGADVVDPKAASIIGILGGVAVVVASALLERAKLDDAVGAVPVHGGAGIVGILCVGLFANQGHLGATGLDRLEAIGVQAIGALSCAVWSYATGLLAWLLVGRLSALRVGPVEETVGMNFSEHQVSNPVQALTQSVFDAREQKKSDALELDNIPDTQFEHLAQAIRALVRDTNAQQVRASQWSQDLDTISGTLDLNQRVGREAMQIYRDELANLDRNLSHIVEHLHEGRFDGSAQALAADSMVNIRRRIELLGHKLPSTMDCWDEINRMAERIDRLASSIRGEVHDVH
jgi:ammonium transporter, Amt family